MQLTMTTDYAIRIVTYLATHQQTITTTELAHELKIPENYIPKVIKPLKNADIISASGGRKGGSTLAKKAEKISLYDIVSCTEYTMAISRCLEKDGYCSGDYINCCKVYKILLDLQNTYNNRLEDVKVSDIVQSGKDVF